MAIQYRRATQSTCFPEETDESLIPFPKTGPLRLHAICDMLESKKEREYLACRIQANA